MFKIADWEIKAIETVDEKITLFQNANKIVAVKNGIVVAIVWEVPAKLPRIETNGAAVVVDEKEHVISIGSSLTLDAIFEYEKEY